MASRRETVLDALKALALAAFPNAKVVRNQAKPARLDPGGAIVVRDGDPGEPEVTLSPLAYTYDHQVHFEIAGYESATLTREQVLDRMVQALGAAVEADRTLGGLCEWLEAEAPITDDGETAGTEPFRWATLTVRATYTVSSPVA